MVFLTHNPKGPGVRAGALDMGGDMDQGPTDMFDDEDYPAYTMGRAAEILGTSQDFLRRLGEVKLVDPQRSAGGHRRYSRRQLRLAARARQLVDQGIALEAACRIILLEDQLEEARGQNKKHQQG
ncbi:MerR family transcriptional regulator [Actinopolymorpha sp. B11F2]|uniref:MerR family transcriptional regulator n=1 Tax=Actinopolymorpha sp. B11F2 TaxID=3160862 RepID=UPI0032E4C844